MRTAASKALPQHAKQGHLQTGAEATLLVLIFFSCDSDAVDGREGQIAKAQAQHATGGKAGSPIGRGMGNSAAYLSSRCRWFGTRGSQAAGGRESWSGEGFDQLAEADGDRAAHIRN